MIAYICSVAPLNQRSPHDSRPHVEVHLNGISLDFLIDTGASLSVISEEIQDNAEPGEITAPRLTRADARRRGVSVEEVPLPRHCHASKRGKNK